MTVAPYSLTVVHIPGSGGGGGTVPGAPGQPTVSGLSSITSGSNTGTGTLSWPASSPGTYPVASYQVYQQGNGGSSTLAGSATTTSFSLTGLTIGASYTYNVVAVDSHGNPSLPSPPVTFTAPPPKASACAGHYAVNSGWPGGFNGTITMTNNGSTAINPWQLTFTFPAAVRRSRAAGTAPGRGAARANAAPRSGGPEGGPRPGTSEGGDGGTTAGRTADPPFVSQRLAPLVIPASHPGSPPPALARAVG